MKGNLIGIAVLTAIVIFAIVDPSLLNMNCCGPSVPVLEEELKERGFTDNCAELCDSKELVEYCAHYFGKGEYKIIDLNKNKIENDIFKINDQKWPACESRIYCFLYTPCRRLGSTQEEIVKQCAELLCHAYLNKYGGNAEYASEAVLDKIKISSNPTECNFLEIYNKEDWHKRFFPENVCEVEKEKEEEVKEVEEKEESSEENEI
ncbi:MAG: hypothetical protein KAU95_02325 [Candidatus Aenigmarchaeota archaeon]|nr:hypothetical protein [Candidatus Aenigmarchaeota archaeon]